MFSEESFAEQDKEAAGVEEKKTVDRHYRLSREAFEIIQNRDVDLFPKERDFVNAAILIFEKDQMIDEIAETVKRIEEKVDQLTREDDYR